MATNPAIASTANARQLRLRMADGVHLSVADVGDVDAPPVLFCHGFGQTRAAWRSTAALLATQGYRCLSVDARGHGASDWLAGGAYQFDQFGSDLLELVRHVGGKPVLVGASMGGLVGLIAEGENAPLFKAMILVDVTPRWETAGVERILAFMRGNPHGFESYEEAAASIATYMPHRQPGKTPDRLRGLLVEGNDGRLRWHWDPALLDVVAGDIAQHQPRLMAATRAIRIPMLLVSGGASDVVSRATIDEFLQLAPHARHVTVAKATHMVAGDDNTAFTSQVGAFLAELD